MVIGEPLMPYEVSIRYPENKKLLTARLNEQDAFDFEPSFQESDVLEIVLNNTDTPDKPRMTFCFVYLRNQWKYIPHDEFELISKYDEMKFGKVKP
jgi:hypothetical protein